jgi:predicted dehydrogenase
MFSMTNRIGLVILLFTSISMAMSCQSPSSAPAAPGSATDSTGSITVAPGPAKAPLVRLLTLNPGHFHAALVQKFMYPDVDSIVHVYAPYGPDLGLHIDRIKAYNAREKDPTHWTEQVYTGKDFFEKMMVQKKGNTVVLSGNNQEKANYIFRSLHAGFNVLADKPMAIDSSGFALLEQSFAMAEKKDLLLYDIMTERFEITSILQRALSMQPGVFGTMEKGSTADPAVVQRSEHHFYKKVSGAALTRPPWFFDTRQQGEGIVDVMTHLVDLAQWECFPETALDYRKDVRVDAARHWMTELNSDEFKEITGIGTYPHYLEQFSSGDTDGLRLYFNGEIDYQLRGVHVKTTATWSYKDPATADDTYYSLLRGSKANLVIRQGADEQFKPTLYIEPARRSHDAASPSTDKTSYAKAIAAAIDSLQAKYPGIGLEKARAGWKVIIPEKYKEGHEAHFARVTENFLGYLKNHDMPAWEVPNMIAKYYTTTKALEMARLGK